MTNSATAAQASLGAADVFITRPGLGPIVELVEGIATLTAWAGDNDRV